ncbi:MAG: response regulator, partial [Chloroflexi bacterium]
LSLLSVAIPKHIRLSVSLTLESLVIRADKTQLQQILMNLVLNAAEAMVDSSTGMITIRTSAVSLTAESVTDWQQLTNEPLMPGPYAQLTIADTGPGISPEQITRIFDPFFTTKMTGRGLGLATVLGIVRGHKGGLRVQSTLGRGTVFELVFPVVPETITTAESPATNSLTTMSHQQTPQPCILVIDDEEPVLEAISDILEMENIQTISARDGDSGIQLFRERREEISLIILDLSLPGMNGEEIFEHIRQIDPNIRIILSSGYSETEVSRRIHRDKNTGFLPKPFRADRLVAYVREFLS